MVGGPHFVALFVGKLALDHISAPAGFIGYGREQCPKAVGRGQVLVAHAGHGGVKGVLAQRLAGVEGAGKDQLTPAAVRLHGLQQLQCLAGQWHAVLLPHLHALGRNGPQGCIHIYLSPACAAHFTGACGGQHEQVQGMHGVGVAIVGGQLAQEGGQLFGI